MSNRRCPALVLGVAVMVGAGFAAACGDGPVSPSGSGNLRIMLTDAPTDDVEKVNIYFTSVTVKPAEGPVEELTLELTENPIDLLTLQDKSVDFAAGAVEPGEYEFMHVNIDAARSNVVVNGVERRVMVPSEEIKIVGGFTVDANKQTAITLDFDAKASLQLLGNGEWLLRPIVLVQNLETR